MEEEEKGESGLEGKGEEGRGVGEMQSPAAFKVDRLKVEISASLS